MPPRKNLEKGRKSLSERTPKKVDKKPKPVKEPSIVKAKLLHPSTKPSSPATPKSPDRTPQRCTRAKSVKKSNADKVPTLNKKELKITLANEVIRTVFEKSKPTENGGGEKESEDVVSSAKKKGRRKKLSCKLQDYTVPGIRRPSSKVVIKENNMQDIVKKKSTPNGDHMAGRLKRKKNLTQPVAGESVTDGAHETVAGVCTPKRRKLADETKATRTHVTKQVEVTRVLRNTRGKQREKQIIASQEDTVSAPSDKRILEADASADQPQPDAQRISGRKDSFTSESTCLSWTRDISSTSTTTCYSVHSNDIVRIDSRLPIIKLTNINLKAKSKNAENLVDTNNSDILSVAESTKNSISLSNQVSVASIAGLNVPNTLDLSTSSLSTEKSDDFSPDPAKRKNVNIINKLKQSLDNCSSNMKNFDLDMINWIGYDTENRDLTKVRFHQRILKELKLENDVIMHCKQIKRILCGDDSAVECANEIVAEENEPEANDETRPFLYFSDLAKSNTIECDNIAMEKNSNIVEQERRESGPLDTFSDSDGESVMTKKLLELDQNMENNDDDDALSLYAESLTGLESSRRNTSVASDQEESTPQAASKDPLHLSEVPSYKPTATEEDHSDQRELNTNRPEKTKAVCEKQTADSTSIYREGDEGKISELQTQYTISKEVDEGSSKESPIMDQIVNSPNATRSIYKQTNVTSSTLFRGVCFFNLISPCNRPMCPYPHVQMTVDVVKSSLQRLSNDMFVQECRIVRNLSVLRQKYGMCFIEECARRDLTKLLIETATYFIVKSNLNIPENVVLTIEVAERMLLYLNGQNLSTFEEDLAFQISPNVLLCDYLLEVISKTQNFSRFKWIFIKLSSFIRQMDRSVSLETCTNLLERFCILPFDDTLAQAFIDILKRTDGSILDNPMMGLLEKQLLMKNGALVEDVLRMRQLHLPASPDTEARYSPDTTNLDTLNKTVEEPIVSGANKRNGSLAYYPSSSESSEKGFPSGPFRCGPHQKWGESGMSMVSAGYSHGYYPHGGRPRGVARGRGRGRARGPRMRPMHPRSYANACAPPRFPRGRGYSPIMY